MKRLLNLLAVLVLIALGAGAFIFFSSGSPPLLKLAPTTGSVGPSTIFSLQATDMGSGLASVSVTARQDTTAVPLLKKAFAGQLSKDLTFSLPAEALDDGDVVLEVTATDASYSNMGEGAIATLSHTVTFDKQPPVISVQSRRHYLDQGGSGLVVFSVSEPVDKAHVRVGALTFPAYRMDNGLFAGLFAFPHDHPKDGFAPAISTTDAAGNATSRPFSVHADSRNFKQDTIRLPDSFLARKAPEFSTAFPGTSTDLDLFLKVNREMRVANRARLREIGATSAPTPLWEGAFMRMRGATKAGFAERRAYVHNGEKVDSQTHLGVDIASVRNAEVPAANHGTVVFAEYLGIYGNCVIVDHGLGLMTLYAHLSSISVQRGQTVAKGDTVGRTGTSGLAGGDHLHYGVLVAGVPVNPLEWWDGTWIANNITSKFQ